MDLDTLKGKTIDDKLHAELVAHVTSLTEARDAARTESIKGRKGKDETIKQLTDRIEAFAERLGVDADADIDSLPNVKGQADAAKQYEAKLTRLQRELSDKSKALDELAGKYSSERRERAIAEQIGKHPFIDPDDARALVASRVKQEGDDLLFTAPDGKLVPLADGVAWFAKTKTHLIRPAGGDAKGSGFKGSKPGETGGKTMTRSEFDALPPAEKAAAARERVTLSD